jgi:hypothetical protein
LPGRQRDRIPAAVERYTAVRTRDDTRGRSLQARKHIVEGHGSSSEHVGKAESRLCTPGGGSDDQSKGLIVRAPIRRFEHALENWLRDRIPRRIGTMNGGGPHGDPSVSSGNLSARNCGDREEDHEQRRSGSCHMNGGFSRPSFGVTSDGVYRIAIDWMSRFRTREKSLLLCFASRTVCAIILCRFDGYPSRYVKKIPPKFIPRRYRAELRSDERTDSFRLQLVRP